MRKWTITRTDSGETEQASDFNDAYKLATKMRKGDEVLDIMEDTKHILIGPCRHEDRLVPVTENVRSLVDGSYEPEIVAYKCPRCGIDVWSIS